MIGKKKVRAGLDYLIQGTLDLLLGVIQYAAVISVYEWKTTLSQHCIRLRGTSGHEQPMK
jgi:hypothetical protein